MFKNRPFSEVKEIYGGLGLAAFGVFYSVQVPFIKVVMQLSLGGSRLFPAVTGIGLIVAGCVIAGNAYYKLARADASGKAAAPTAKEKSPEEKRAGRRGVLLTFAYFTAYVAVLRPVGFLVATFFYLFAMIHLLAPRGEKKPLHYLLLAFVCVMSVYFIFTKCFDLVLPYGILYL